MDIVAASSKALEHQSYESRDNAADADDGIKQPVNLAVSLVDASIGLLNVGFQICNADLQIFHVGLKTA
jgi:hypothetical protein